MRIILLYPRFRSIHLKKEPGQIAYHLSKLGHEVIILGIKLDRFSNLIRFFSFPKNMKFINIRCTSLYKLINSRHFILISNLLLFPLYLLYLLILKPDVSIAFLRESPITALLFYKIFFNRNSLVIIKLDLYPKLWFTKRPIRIKYYIAYFTFSLIYHFVDILIIESPQAEEDLVKKFPFLKRKLLMLPDGVAEEYYLKFIDIKTNSSIVSENVILFVGSVEYRKGIDTLLKAFGIVKNEFPDWVVKIVGPINSSEYKRFLDKLVKSQGLKDKVIFVGYLDGKDLVREFLNSSIFVLPSRHESFGIVLVEAAFFGKPIISSNVGAAEYLLDHGKAGLLFEPNDLQSLANLLKTMMLSKELRDKFGKEVKSRYLRLFSWKKNILRLSIIINYLASNKR